MPIAILHGRCIYICKWKKQTLDQLQSRGVYRQEWSKMKSWRHSQARSTLWRMYVGHVWCYSFQKYVVTCINNIYVASLCLFQYVVHMYYVASYCVCFMLHPESLHRFPDISMTRNHPTTYMVHTTVVFHPVPLCGHPSYQTHQAGAEWVTKPQPVTASAASCVHGGLTGDPCRSSSPWRTTIVYDIVYVRFRFGCMA